MSFDRALGARDPSGECRGGPSRPEQVVPGRETVVPPRLQQNLPRSGEKRPQIGRLEWILVLRLVRCRTLSTAAEIEPTQSCPTHAECALHF